MSKRAPPRHVHLLGCHPRYAATCFLVLSWDYEGFHIHSDTVQYLRYEAYGIDWVYAEPPLDLM